MEGRGGEGGKNKVFKPNFIYSLLDYLFYRIEIKGEVTIII